MYSFHSIRQYIFPFPFLLSLLPFPFYFHSVSSRLNSLLPARTFQPRRHARDDLPEGASGGRRAGSPGESNTEWPPTLFLRAPSPSGLQREHLQTDGKSVTNSDPSSPFSLEPHGGARSGRVGEWAARELVSLEEYFAE